MDYGRMLDDHVRNLAQMTIACIDVPLSQASGFNSRRGQRFPTASYLFSSPERLAK
jgi:hypothetical protein